MGNGKIDTLKKTRVNLLLFISDLTTDELNKIPTGFNNNIIWNLAHLLATQQSICYIRAGLRATIDEKYVLNFKPGTKPENFIEDDEIQTIKGLFLTAIEGFEHDHQNNLFVKYSSWSNRYGMEINTIDEALTFVLFHEGLHLGYCMALKRILRP